MSSKKAPASKFEFLIARKEERRRQEVSLRKVFGKVFWKKYSKEELLKDTPNIAPTRRREKG
jgi:hypothetical protein